MSCPRVELAAPADVPALADVERAAASLLPPELLPPGLRSAVLPVDVLVEAQEQGRLWVARSDAQDPVGFALATVVGRHALLSEIDVHPNHGGRGIGRSLLSTVIEWARGRGCDALYLTTFRNFSRSAALYRRAGFVAAVDTPAFLVATLEHETALGLRDRVAMRLSLHERS